ncbi:ATP-binding protein [Aquiflexum gelatinilyticum]|uniref:ATP-binding protein n=1 Tax=Aquiflexum gelatinilyticum TaxID=2961943 RepID=A0A9X2P1Z2_9BACT|nr:ATP-binding protein [Aquiflexum gelatinilyticum]MCR9013946.1 ATP-binding protein [Aquiflexum gelatinilyticum]
MDIERLQRHWIGEKLHKGKVIIVIGPRQVGKTTLVNELLKSESFLFLDGDDPTVRELLNSPNTEQLKSILGNYSLVFIDEAQRIKDIGITLKIIHDRFKDVQLLVSGSSSFELSGLTQEPLTGRKWTFFLYPISWEEWEKQVGYVRAEQSIEERLVFGMYPEILTNVPDQKELLLELSESYLYKDIFSLGLIKKPDAIHRLLQALAYQVGNEVSFNELSNLLKIDVKTVISYIELLEQAFVIFRLGTFSRNLHNEIKTNKKIYFYDNGVRNALINNFQPVSLRNDIGALWENFLISERVKLLEYHKMNRDIFFWRTKFQQEIDFVETFDGKVLGFEFKWNPKQKVNFPASFIETYQAETKVIHRDNFREFVMGI